MARLAGSTISAVQHDRLNVARTFARDHGLIVVLKGHRTLIAQPDGAVWVNTTGNPGMATGGTGDILTGMVAGLMAQNPDRIAEAVMAAVHLHGLAGDVARRAWASIRWSRPICSVRYRRRFAGPGTRRKRRWSRSEAKTRLANGHGVQEFVVTPNWPRARREEYEPPAPLNSIGDEKGEGHGLEVAEKLNLPGRSDHGG